MMNRSCKILRQQTSKFHVLRSCSHICDSEDQKAIQRLEMQLKKQNHWQKNPKKPRHVHGTHGNHHSPTHPLRSIFHSR